MAKLMLEYIVPMCRERLTWKLSYAEHSFIHPDYLHHIIQSFAVQTAIHMTQQFIARWPAYAYMPRSNAVKVLNFTTEWIHSILEDV